MNDLQIARNGIAQSIREQRARARRYAGTQWADHERAVLYGLRLAAATLKGIRWSQRHQEAYQRRIAASTERFL